MRLALFAATAATLLSVGSVLAAEPATATVSPAMPETRFASASFLPTAGCVPFTTCDSFELTVDVSAGFAAANPQAMVRVALAWDFKLDLFTFDLVDLDTGTSAALQSISSDLGSETLYVPVGTGPRKFRLDMSPAAASNSIVLGRVGLFDGVDGGLRPNPQGPGLPRYQVYEPPAGLSGNTGEPSVGYNQASGQSFILSGLKTLFLDYPQNLTPALPLACEGEWEERSAAITSVTTLDPIGFSDSLVRGHETSRTWIGQLAGANSAMAFSDDDGATWTPNQGGPFASAVDHQTIGAGPFPPPLNAVPNPIYPNAFYYCGQDIGFASCARSDNGGLTFGPSTTVFTVADCAGIHGHVRVAPDGTVYLPSKACGPNVAISVSTNGAATWTQHAVPDSQPSIRDPSVAIATDNTAFFCYSDGDRNARVSVTSDRGESWERTTDLGKEMGIKHVMFTHAIAGDGDRATCAYLGTTTEGNPVALDFPGIWHVYFSTTYDRGATWVTVNATPTDPVQGVGGIWNSGGGNVNRNLLDFNEITLDEKGFPIYGFADGCTGACDQDPTLNPYAAFPKIARQIGGKSLYAEFDVAEPRAPANACLQGQRTTEKTQLNWKVPENGGAAISQYRIYRSTSPDVAITPANLVGTTDGTPGFIDPTAELSVEKYYYKVVAVNAASTSIGSNEIELPIVTPVLESTCVAPGITMAMDVTGDSNIPGTDLVSLNIAEPQDADGKLVFQIVADGASTAPEGTMFAALFHTPDQPLANPNDRFVGVVMDAAGPSFVYGDRTEQVIGIAVVQTYSVVGELDAGSRIEGDVITLVLPRSVYGLKDSDRLSVVSMNSHTGAMGSGEHIVRSTNTLDTAEAGQPYSLRTASLCLPNTAPLARLVATPVSGTAPLTVMLDATSSSDAEEAIVEYSFNPGDGSAVTTQPGAMLSRTYTQPGNYRATVSVKDARGLVSASVAQAIIEVKAAGATPVPGTGDTAVEQGRFGGGVFGGSLVLLGLMLAALRRRR